MSVRSPRQLRDTRLGDGKEPGCWLRCRTVPKANTSLPFAWTRAGHFMVAGLQELPMQGGQDGLGCENRHSRRPDLPLAEEIMGRTIRTLMEGKRLCRGQRSLIGLEP